MDSVCGLVASSSSLTRYYLWPVSHQLNNMAFPCLGMFVPSLSEKHHSAFSATSHWVSFRSGLSWWDTYRNQRNRKGGWFLLPSSWLEPNPIPCLTSVLGAEVFPTASQIIYSVTYKSITKLCVEEDLTKQRFIGFYPTALFIYFTFFG